MEHAFSTRIRWATSIGAIGALIMLLPGCTEPVHVAWNETQSVIEPEVPRPQGILDVYSERYVFYDADVPRIHRRPVEVYNVDGKIIANVDGQDGESPLHFDLAPGHYIVASESNMQWREVEVDVQDGRDTVVAESQLKQAPLLASLQTERAMQVATRHSDRSR